MTDAEKHWDTLCLGTVTLATAVLAAVIVVAGFSEAGAQFAHQVPRHLVYWRLAVVGIAGACYLGLAVSVLGAVFVARGSTEPYLSRKYRLALASYGLFILQVIALAVLLVVNVAIDWSSSDLPAKREAKEAVQDNCLAFLGSGCCISIIGPQGETRRFCPSD